MSAVLSAERVASQPPARHRRCCGAGGRRAPTAGQPPADPLPLLFPPEATRGPAPATPLPSSCWTRSPLTRCDHAPRGCIPNYTAPARIPWTVGRCRGQRRGAGCVAGSAWRRPPVAPPAAGARLIPCPCARRPDGSSNDSFSLRASAAPSSPSRAARPLHASPHPLILPPQGFGRVEALDALAAKGAKSLDALKAAVAELEAAVAELKGEQQSNGQVYIKLAKKAAEKVGRARAAWGGGRHLWVAAIRRRHGEQINGGKRGRETAGQGEDWAGRELGRERPCVCVNEKVSVCVRTHVCVCVCVTVCTRIRAPACAPAPPRSLPTPLDCDFCRAITPQHTH
jgi:hypothetical protein